LNLCKLSYKLTLVCPPSSIKVVSRVTYESVYKYHREVGSEFKWLLHRQVGKMVKPLVVYEQSDYDVGRQVGKALLDGY
jgi:hypothetical protein